MPSPVGDGGQGAGPFPASVARRLTEYCARLASEQVSSIRGLYLVGSIALGDFRDGLSDIDFVALLDAPPGPEDIARLARIHAAMGQAEGPCFDGLYLCVDALPRPPSEPAFVPFVVEGVFVTDRPCFEVSPVLWSVLARHGRRVFGPSPSELAVADDAEALGAHQRDNLRTYWTSWVGQFEAALDAGRLGPTIEARHFAWGVLGVSRIACTLATGRIVSKSEAGRWAAATLPAAWRSLLQEASSARDGTLPRVDADRFRAALAYMRLVIAQAPGYQVPDTAPPRGRPLDPSPR